MDATHVKEIGARLRRRRLRASLTIKEMAEKTGFSVEQVIRYEETGKIPLKHFQEFWRVLSDKPFPQWFEELTK